MKATVRTVMLVTAVLFFSNLANAEEPPKDADSTGWKLSLDGALAATQSAYSDNWQGGELGSFNWTFTSNSSAEKQISPKLNWANTLKLSFGLTYSQKRLTNGTAKWQRPEKNTDLIDLESVARLTLHGFVDPYLAGRLQTEFYDGSVRAVRRFFSPATITESGGILRVFADGSKSESHYKVSLKSRFGFGLRQIITSVIVDTAAETTSSNTTNDGGLESVTDLNIEVGKDIKYTGKLTMYKALFFSESDTAPNDDWKTVDINWEHIVTAQVTKYIQTSLYVQLLYDKQIDTGARIKQTLGMGVSVNIL